MSLMNRTAAKSVTRFIFGFSLIALVVACGKAPQNQGIASLDTGIIGGSDASGSEEFAKHTVALYDTKVGSLCTASILSETIAVTAAHCVDSPATALRMVFGGDIDSATIIVRPVAAYKTSPLWAIRQNQEFNTGDIAVIKFEGGLPPGYSAAKFLTDATLLTDNADVLLAGYGASIAAMVLDPKTGVFSADHTGAGKLRSVTTSILKATFSVSEFLTEASKGKSACHGDSGGPAYVMIDGEALLVGVTSRGVGDVQNLCNVAAAYTSIPFYSSWIVSTAKQLDPRGGALTIASLPVTPAPPVSSVP